MTNNKPSSFIAEYQQLADISNVLSHPARIAIIQLLSDKKEIKAGNISDYLPLGRTAVSRHLKELKDAGIIKGNIDGLKIHYCLNVEKLTKIKKQYADFLDSSISSYICNC